jgi:hypothetical protein
MPSGTLPSDLLPSPGPQDSPQAQASPGLASPGPAFPGLAFPGLASVPELARLRIITVPDTAPPYDCETHGTACPAMRDAAGASPDSPDRAPESVGLRTETAKVPGSPEASVSRQASPASAGMTAAWPRQFAQAIVEILAGSRSPRQLVRWTTDRARRQIDLLTPLFAADQRPRIKRIVTSRPTSRTVEMTVIVSSGQRTRALAMRFEHTPARPAAPGRPARPARWLCTELEAG